MQKQVLQTRYNQYMEELVMNVYNDGDEQTRNSLLNAIYEIQKNMIACDFLEKLLQISKKGDNFELIALPEDLKPIFKEDFNKLVYEENYGYIYPKLYNKDLYETILKKTVQAAEFTEPVAAMPRAMAYQQAQYTEAFLARMTSLQAVESESLSSQINNNEQHNQKCKQ